MFRPRRTAWISLPVGLVAAFLGWGGCAPSDSDTAPGDTSVTVTTAFGSFARKTILVGGVGLAASFQEPAYGKIGPDGRLYVTSYTGSLYAIALDANHKVVAVTESKPFVNRLLTGLAFDPNAPVDKPVLYVANNDPPLYSAADFSGRVSRIDDLAKGATTDLIVGLPRSTDNHMTFEMEFGPDGRLYIAQGGMTNNGAPASGLFGDRSEHGLSAAILVADVKAAGFSGIGSVAVYAPGLRNPYGIAWHSNGNLYALDQGSNKGFGGRPNPDGTVTDIPISYPDGFNLVLPDRYYGHPNPARNQYSFRADLPDGTPYLPPLTTFNPNTVATGLCEYTANTTGASNLRRALLATGFVDGKLYYLLLSADGRSLATMGVLASGFANPLDVTVGPDGAIYVIEAGGSLAFGGTGPSQITVLEPLAGSSGVKPALFAASGKCTDCHSLLATTAGTDVSIDRDWRPTMMANALRDPLFQAKVSSEVARAPALQEAIESKCATCHAPMARTQSLADDEPVALSGGGFLSMLHPRYAIAIDGVSCTLCHQIQDVDLGEAASFSGGYSIDRFMSPPDRLIFGPFAVPQASLMRSAAGFTPAEGRHVKKSGLCATCHTLYTSAIDAAGNVVGEFPEQTPYLEWEHSAFGDGVGTDRSCQDCHVPAADGPAAIASLPSGLTPKSPFGQHHFVGGNAFLLTMFRANAAALGVQASAGELDTTIARTLTQLQSLTASLSFAAAQRAGGYIDVDVALENRSGHKFPTGYPARRAWLRLRVTDGVGSVFFDSGAVQADGRIVGDDAETNSASYEPHYDLITSASQVQIYEAVMADSDGQVTRTLLRAASYAKDNRLLPAGFEKTTADADIAVRGEAAADDDFLGGGDRIAYRIDASGRDGPFTLRAELLYQPVPPVFVDDLARDGTDSVSRFANLYNAADRSPVVVAAEEAVVP